MQPVPGGGKSNLNISFFSSLLLLARLLPAAISSLNNSKQNYFAICVTEQVLLMFYRKQFLPKGLLAGRKLLFPPPYKCNYVGLQTWFDLHVNDIVLRSTISSLPPCINISKRSSTRKRIKSRAWELLTGTGEHLLWMLWRYVVIFKRELHSIRTFQFQRFFNIMVCRNGISALF